MPGLRLYFSLLGDDSGQRNEIWLPSNRQSIRMVRSLITDHLKESKNFNEKLNKLRLFFNGQELQDDYTIANYGVEHSDHQVVQVLIQPSNYAHLESNQEHLVESNEDDDDPLKFKINVELLNSDEYYEIGDYCDAFDPSTGAWFPGRISQIKRSDDELYYYVTFMKPSLGSYVPKRLSHVRPQPYRIIEKNQLEPGQRVMVLNADGQWYVGAIETIKQSQLNRSTSLWLTLFTHGQQMPLVRQMIKFKHGNVVHLESNVKRDNRTEQIDKIIKFGSKIERQILPDCLECKDNPNKPKCLECGCQKCHLKNDPDKQLVCDECNRSTHLWCLRKPLKEIPKEPDWYCDQCSNETQQQIMQKQQQYLNSIKTTKWPSGMSTVGRSQTPLHSNQFGSIKNVPVGTWWRFRVQCSEAGVHLPLVAGIHGREKYGAYSLVYAAICPNDVDLGEEIFYTANPGKNCQQFKREVLALAQNCPVKVNDQFGGNAGNDWRNGKPIRLLRSGNGRLTNDKRSKYLPKIGIRYDGLYKIVKYWPETGINGNRVWRFLLRRDDPEPAPWTEKGRYQARKHGLTLQYPNGWCTKLGQKRCKKMDETMFKKQKLNSTKQQSKQTEIQEPKMEPFEIPEHLKQLILLDEMNNKTWNQLLNNKMDSKQQFKENVTLTFRCVCCMDMVQEPITSKCGHNFCLDCIQQSFLSNQEDTNHQKHCPVCREPSFLDCKLNSNANIRIIKTNSILQTILNQIEKL